jgi:hypothetical protein
MKTGAFIFNFKKLKMKKLFLLLLVITIFASGCRREFNSVIVNKALEKGKVANEGYSRCLKFVEAWLTKRDSASGLIPTNLTKGIDQWQVCNSAADNYPFMVLTGYLLDKSLYNGPLLDMLNAEKKLTSRFQSIPDDYSFSKRGFVRDVPDMNWIVFSTAEYIKDGLIPLNEYLGKTPWQDRMIEMTNDLSVWVTVVKDIEKLGGYMAPTEEINGDLLQLLSRIFWITGDRKYLDRAVKIGDYYMSGERDLTKVNYLRIRDHGCEIIGGLSELYFALHFAIPKKQAQYKEPFHKLLDRVLEIGRNEDGLFYNAVNMNTGEVADSGMADTWGYVLDAFYTVWLLDKTVSYREAVLKSFSRLYEKYRNFAWEGKSQDGYADALESGINLMNREPDPGVEKWIDSEIKVMWGKQQEDGIIEGWHGDGNFARTTIMYCLWKTLGAHVIPWRKDVIIGAEKSGDEIIWVLTSEKEWEGTLVFDHERHKEILHLPLDYTRLNQFPEWFTVKPDRNYILKSSVSGISGKYKGNELINGIPVRIEGGKQFQLMVKEM